MFRSKERDKRGDSRRSVTYEPFTIKDTTGVTHDISVRPVRDTGA